MWIDAHGEMARQVHEDPQTLLADDTLELCYAAPSAQLRELLSIAVRRATENPYEAGVADLDGAKLGAPGQVIPAELLTGFRSVKSWAELRKYVLAFPDDVPIEWRWDAWLLVYVLVSEIHGARLRRAVSRLRSRFRGMRSSSSNVETD